MAHAPALQALQGHVSPSAPWPEQHLALCAASRGFGAKAVGLSRGRTPCPRAGSKGAPKEAEALPRGARPVVRAAAAGGTNGGADDEDAPKIGSRRGRRRGSSAQRPDDEGATAAAATLSAAPGVRAGAMVNPAEPSAVPGDAVADGKPSSNGVEGLRALQQQQQGQGQAEGLARRPRIRERRIGTTAENRAIWKREDGGEDTLAGLVVCVGEPVLEFVPSVRASSRQAPDEVYASWRSMQWVPPDFARAPGATSCQVALALGRMGVPVAFVGAVGEDQTGAEILELMATEGVHTDSVIPFPDLQTGITQVALQCCEYPSLESALPQQAAVASLPQEDAVRDVLQQATWLHCTSLSFTGDADTAAAVKQSLEIATSAGAKAFLDVNLPLPLWQSKEDAWEALAHVWGSASVIELSRSEAEFLLGEEPYVRRREARCRYAAESYSQLRSMWDDYHYSPEEVAPLWANSDGKLELLIITDGTVMVRNPHLLIEVQYYTREFHGSVDGTEDVLVAAMTCDRAGSGDAMVAAMIRKLMQSPEIVRDQDQLERALRFAISAGVISQWTTGAVRSFPTAEATQNLTEQMFLTSLV